MTLRFALTLHSHLPWVLHHGRWPHGSDWICEAALECYLPLIAMLDRAEAEQTPTPITLGVTPVLAAQLAHPAFQVEMEEYFTTRLRSIEAATRSLPTSGDEALLHLVPFWRHHVRALRDLWQRMDGDIVAAFRRHAERGRLELISSAATHGFLPLLARDESIRLQLHAGRHEHQRRFGMVPEGLWLPECAYRPRGPWHPAPFAPGPALRRGIEEHLSRTGYRWFFVDAHLVDAGLPVDEYGATSEPEPKQHRRSPYRPYQVGRPRRGAPVRALVRDPRSTSQVWSRYGGYPGDGRYLEFHKIRFPEGLKLWSVTGAEAGLAAKQPYDAEAAHRAIMEHATHFTGLLEAIDAGARKSDQAIVAPFDTELFGHWWFEGVSFLGEVYRRLAQRHHLLPAHAGQVAAADQVTALRMEEGSWGANGDFTMWMNPQTEWTWARLWPLEQRFWDAVPGVLDRPDLTLVLEQAARELLLAQSSDWQFIISTGVAGDYATRRFTEHCDNLESLLPSLEGHADDATAARARAGTLQQQNGLFEGLVASVAAASDAIRAGE